MGQSDFELIDQFLEGEESAFDELVQKYQREVYRLAYRMTHSEDDAKDLAQETFLQVYRSLRGFRRQSSFYTWLCRITVNLRLNHLRAAGRADPLGQDHQVSDGSADMLEELLQEERKQAVASAIIALPPQQRVALTLRVHQSLSYKETWRDPRLLRGGSPGERLPCRPRASSEAVEVF